jgi:hypothetical protein
VALAQIVTKETFPKVLPENPRPLIGGAGNFGKSGPVRKIPIPGKTGNFGKQSQDSALEPMSIRSLDGGNTTAVFSHDETEVV